MELQRLIAEEKNDRALRQISKRVIEKKEMKSTVSNIFYLKRVYESNFL